MVLHSARAHETRWASEPIAAVTEHAQRPGDAGGHGGHASGWLQTQPQSCLSWRKPPHPPPRSPPARQESPVAPAGVPREPKDTWGTERGDNLVQVPDFRAQGRQSPEGQVTGARPSPLTVCKVTFLQKETPKLSKRMGDTQILPRQSAVHPWPWKVDSRPQDSRGAASVLQQESLGAGGDTGRPSVAVGGSG